MNRHRLDVTGRGLVSSFGEGVVGFFKPFLAGPSAIGHLRADDLSRRLSVAFVAYQPFDAASALGQPPSNMMDRFVRPGVRATALVFH